MAISWQLLHCSNSRLRQNILFKKKGDSFLNPGRITPILCTALSRFLRATRRPLGVSSQKLKAVLRDGLFFLRRPCGHPHPHPPPSARGPFGPQGAGEVWKGRANSSPAPSIGAGWGGGVLSFCRRQGGVIGASWAVSILPRHAREGGRPRLGIDERSHGYPGSGGLGSAWGGRPRA